MKSKQLLTMIAVMVAGVIAGLYAIAVGGKADVPLLKDVYDAWDR